MKEPHLMNDHQMTPRPCRLRHAARRRPLVPAVTLGAAWMCCAAAAFAQPAPAGPRVDSALPGRTDVSNAPATTEPTSQPSAPLDPAFKSAMAGISVKPPAGGTMRVPAGGGDEIVRFYDEHAKWTFVVSRIVLSEPMAMSTRDPEAAKNDPKLAGFADTLAANMANDMPGQFIRNDLIPIAGNDGAVLATRFTDPADHTKRLMQQAVIHRTDKLYYILTYTTPMGDGELNTDAAAIGAVATFNQILDSVQMIDQDAIVQDQTERLFRTRALMVNWSPDRLNQALVPEQWLRLMRDGKDIGYTYMVEEVASDVPRKGSRTDAAGGAAPGAERKDPSNTSNIPGVRVGIRSRTMPGDNTVVDAETWAWVRYDRKQESFRNALQTKQGNDPPTLAVEFGTSVNRDRTVPIIAPPQNGQPAVVGPAAIQPGKDDRFDLSVWSTSSRSTHPPFNQQVPPFYLSQALVHMLPRLLPLNEPKGYLFASYSSEDRSVKLRYVDVLPARSVKLPAMDGPAVVAVPIQERAGYEGSITTHYMTPDGQYLGSTNDDAKITILATNQATLQRIWHESNLQQRPADVEEQPQGSSAPQPTPTPRPQPQPRPQPRGTPTR